MAGDTVVLHSLIYSLLGAAVAKTSSSSLDGSTSVMKVVIRATTEKMHDSIATMTLRHHQYTGRAHLINKTW